MQIEQEKTQNIQTHSKMTTPIKPLSNETSPKFNDGQQLLLLWCKNIKSPEKAWLARTRPQEKCGALNMVIISKHFFFAFILHTFNHSTETENEKRLHRSFFGCSFLFHFYFFLFRYLKRKALIIWLRCAKISRRKCKLVCKLGGVAS